MRKAPAIDRPRSPGLLACGNGKRTYQYSRSRLIPGSGMGYLPLGPV